MMSGVRASSIRMESTFVHDGEGELALDAILQMERQIVAQVIRTRIRCWSRRIDWRRWL